MGMNRSVTLSIALLFAVSALGGCTDLRRALGLEKAPPDEFAVMPGAPLTLPPDYGLRPPHSITGAPLTPTPNQQARVAVFRLGDAQKPAGGSAGTDSTAEPLTAGEQAIMTKAGAVGVDPRIRKEVDAETRQYADATEGFVDSLLFWKAPPDPTAGNPVDAGAEANRIRKDQAEGKSVAPPTIDLTNHAVYQGMQ